MKFEPARPGDVAAVRSIARASWESDYPELISRETIHDGIDQWYDAEELHREIETGDALVLLGIDEENTPEGRDPRAREDVVAFAHAVVPDDAGDVGHLLRLYVHPERRREGIGSGLLEATVDALEAQGVEDVRAMVLSANEVGKSFYRAHGFEPVETAETTIGGESHEETTFERGVTVRPDLA